MKITAKATDPLSQEFEMTITMSLADWIRLSEGMDKNVWFGPVDELRTAIRLVQSQAKAKFENKIEVK